MLADPDRPVTWDAARASRDLEGWTALGTYGHPHLEGVLAKRSGQHLPDSSALVLTATGDGLPAAAVRADRTPPGPVSALAELDDLGSPTARGEAETYASALALRAATAVRDYEAQVLSVRPRQSVDALRQRFVSLVHDTLAAGCAASRFDGVAGADPITVWYGLGQDATSV